MSLSSSRQDRPNLQALNEMGKETLIQTAEQFGVKVSKKSTRSVLINALSREFGYDDTKPSEKVSEKSKSSKTPSKESLEGMTSAKLLEEYGSLPGVNKSLKPKSKLIQAILDHYETVPTIVLVDSPQPSPFEDVSKKELMETFTIPELKEEIEDRGIEVSSGRRKRNKSKLVKDDFITILKAPECDPEAGCGDSRACEIPNNVCVPDRLKPPSFEKAKINGHKVIGSPDAIRTLQNKLKSTRPEAPRSPPPSSVDELAEQLTRMGVDTKGRLASLSDFQRKILECLIKPM